MVTTNYPLSLKFKEFSPHAHLWSDTKVTDFMNRYYYQKPKDCLFIARTVSVKKEQQGIPLLSKIDYWFYEHYYKLKGNFTAYWITQLIQHYFPKKKIAIFGLDGFVPDDLPKVEGHPVSKWYDYYTDFDSKGRKQDKYVKNLGKFSDSMEKGHSKNPEEWVNTFNCNLGSKIEYIQKKEFKAVIKNH
jgi:hypothetical protein